MAVTDRLPGWRRPLAVVAHPDDESFGLGAVLSTFQVAGARPAVLCFTHGEASTLHGVEGDLHTLRAEELTQAARLLGIDAVDLRDEPDGGLAAQDQNVLAASITQVVKRWGCDGLVAFDLGGVTGHPDHDAATRAAILAAGPLGLGVLGWCLPEKVAGVLNNESGTSFSSRSDLEIDIVIDIERERQLAAVRAHPSQAVPGSILWRRLDLLGNHEHLRWLLPTTPTTPTPSPA